MTRLNILELVGSNDTPRVFPACRVPAFWNRNDNCITPLYRIFLFLINFLEQLCKCWRNCFCCIFDHVCLDPVASGSFIPGCLLDGRRDLTLLEIFLQIAGAHLCLVRIEVQVHLEVTLGQRCGRESHLVSPQPLKVLLPYPHIALRSRAYHFASLGVQHRPEICSSLCVQPPKAFDHLEKLSAISDRKLTHFFLLGLPPERLRLFGRFVRLLCHPP